ncbi:MAG: 2Fe-2S iron-sulfur cluster binding domain-containing protein [Bermanella sp.]
MFSLFSKKGPKRLSIKGIEQVIEVQAKETILQAALRSNVAFPHSCRVGGCAACKCKLASGHVKELIESSYVLSAQELKQGYILACQSVPKGDISIEVALDTHTSQFEAKSLTGSVVKQWPLTHDITALEVELPTPLPFVSGQYADISLPGLSDASRSYSFSKPYDANKNLIQFFIKHVPGGELSPIVMQKKLVGQQIQIDGPYGDFHLREDSSAIICIAGGSGLAPVKALLEQALSENVKRDVTFIFAARTQQDLYCLDEIKNIEKNWPANFKFVVVLSDEPKTSNWRGHRGYVTDVMAEFLSGNEQAYLCGPTLMINAAVATLRKYSIPANKIFFDKFITKADVVAA